MTSREIVKANLERLTPERPGMNFGAGRMNDICFSFISPAANYQPKNWIEGNFEYYDDDWGNVWHRVIGGCEKGEIYKPVLKDWEDLEKLQIPDYSQDLSYVEMNKVFSQEVNKEKYKIVGIGGLAFNDARYLRKMEIYLMDMALYEDELKKLHAMIMQVYHTKVNKLKDSGADAIMFWEDMGTQQGLLFSPNMWRNYFKEEYTNLFGLAHSMGMKVFMHSCGHNWDILDDLMDAGVDCFQFDQPAVYDMPALARKLAARKVALFSPVDTQQVLPTGRRDFIEAETRRMLELFQGGLIMKDYPDLNGIGVKPEWDNWAYNVIVQSFS